MSYDFRVISRLGARILPVLNERIPQLGRQEVRRESFLWWCAPSGRKYGNSGEEAESERLIEARAEVFTGGMEGGKGGGRPPEPTGFHQDQSLFHPSTGFFREGLDSERQGGMEAGKGKVSDPSGFHPSSEFPCFRAGRQGATCPGSILPDLTSLERFPLSESFFPENGRLSTAPLAQDDFSEILRKGPARAPECNWDFLCPPPRLGCMGKSYPKNCP